MSAIAFFSRALPLKRSPYPMSTGLSPFFKASPKYWDHISIFQGFRGPTYTAAHLDILIRHETIFSDTSGHPLAADHTSCFESRSQIDNSIRIIMHVVYWNKIGLKCAHIDLVHLNLQEHIMLSSFSACACVGHNKARSLNRMPLCSLTWSVQGDA